MSWFSLLLLDDAQSQDETAAPDAVLWLTELAAQARIRSLNMRGVASSSIVIKKLPVDRYLGSDKAGGEGILLPAVVLWPLKESIVPVLNTVDDVTYRIGCAAVAVDNQEQTVAAGMSQWHQWRQQMRRAFSNQGKNSIPGLPPTVYFVGVQPMTNYDDEAWTKGLDVSFLTLIFTSREPRGLNA